MQRALLEVAHARVACGPLGVWVLLLPPEPTPPSRSRTRMLPGLVVAALAGAPLLLGAAGGVLVAAAGDRARGARRAHRRRRRRRGRGLGAVRPRRAARAVARRRRRGSGSCCSATCWASRPPTCSPPVPRARRRCGARRRPPPAGADRVRPRRRALAGRRPARWETALLVLLGGRHGGRRAGARQPAARRADPRARRGGAEAHAPAPAALALAAGLAAAAGVAGLALSYYADIAAGASVALCAVAAPILTRLETWFRHAIIWVVPVRDPNISSAVEDYAKAIYALEARRLRRGHRRPRWPSAWASPPRRRRAWSASSDELGLVTHVPYKGVQLTAEGARLALEVLRHHRLLELYLASRSACRGTACTTRPRCSSTCCPRSSRTLIAAKLGNPTHDPHGDPIPTPTS